MPLNFLKLYRTNVLFGLDTNICSNYNEHQKEGVLFKDGKRQQETLDYYCGNNMARLRQIAYPIFTRFGGISVKDYDEFYSEANRTVWSAAASFDVPGARNSKRFLKAAFHGSSSP